MTNNYLETVIFFYVLKHPELVKHYKGKFFSTRYYQELFDVIKPYILEYKEEPPEAQVKDLVKLADKGEFLTDDIISTIWSNRADITGYSEDWLFNNTKAFAEWNNFYRGLQRVTAYTKQMQAEVTFENCESIINKAKQIWGSEMAFNIGTETGHDFFDVATHIIPDETTQTTGYQFFDMCLGGGWSKGTVNCLMAAPKTGKTMWLCNLAANSVTSGANSIFISLEMSYQKIAQRIGAAMFGIPLIDYPKLSKDNNYMQQAMQKYFRTHMMSKPGKLILERFPTGTASMDDIEGFILKKEEELSTPDKPFKFDNVFIDYANIMQSIQFGKTENLYLKVKSICEEFRASCIRNNWAGITATQINRSGYGSTDLDMTNVSESAGLLATVDSLFGIIRTPLMKQAGVYYIKAVLTRDSDCMGYKKKFNIDKSTIKIEEDLHENFIDEGIEIPEEWKSESVYDLKRQNVGSPTNVKSNGLTPPQQSAAKFGPSPTVGSPTHQPTEQTIESLLDNETGTARVDATPKPNTYQPKNYNGYKYTPKQHSPQTNGEIIYPSVDIGLTESQLAGIPLDVFK